ncbi:probable cyclin-dependent serine/threonine-protein kinase DDB_G0292550 [Contarinia nasturtii]|uniref:probable cyclin-dependent serine/threonine-protein kinase DDB_G0292550 n=1 Tax=Contarinia nasturtii TaxID=265458 RepID=UPI0012D40AB3|nr:probable cyclin-dependent serine/threonine-protein kinase DDB_G0292550 [Contarinia nasturtii]
MDIQDKVADDSNKSSNNSKNVYKMHDSNVHSLDVVCKNTGNNNNNNNNNNDHENMENVNSTTMSNQKFDNSMRQDSINSDFSPLTDSIQMNGVDERHRNSLEMRAADDEYSINDNQSNVSDDDGASDNNSTDNISFVSEEDIVENVILLPNNFLSDDESTNSDDVVYAYRGADFEPIQVNLDVNGDDETDYLEMDFEPESTSEPNQSISIEPNCSHLAGSSNNFNANLYNTMSNAMNNESNNAQVNLNTIERTGVHKNWLAPIEVRLNGIHKEINDASSIATNRNENSHSNDNINIHWTNNNNKLEAHIDSMENESNNKSLAVKQNANKILSVTGDDVNSPYYDNTVSLSTKKYTGTIPKTNKLNIRPRSKTTAPDFLVNGNGLARFESHVTEATHSSLELWTRQSEQQKQQQNSQTHKRWKVSDREKSASSSYCDNLGGLTSGIDTEDSSSCKHRPVIATRSMSFPNEDSLDQRIPTAIMSDIMGQPHCKREIEIDIDQSISVTFESTYCTIDTIIKALDKIHVLPDLRALQKALHDDDEGKVSQMNIPEYLEYTSKRYCNYKAIIAAIEQSCDDVDVKYFALPEAFPPETIHIPVRMIANRLPTNGSLDNILKIKNKRFHQMNVLGKIVNLIRKFPSMRPDLIQNEIISIPQFYRSGVICISKKKSSSNQI